MSLQISGGPILGSIRQYLIVSWVLLCLLAGPGLAVEPAADEFQIEGGWLYYRPGFFPHGGADRPLRPKPAEKEAAEWTKPIPFSFSIDYTLVSDYVYRGANYSEYAAEGREKLNHQLGVGLELDTSELGWNIGSFGFSLWGEWYAGQKALDPASSSTFQEADYIIYWRYEIPQTYMTLETGWVALTFPQLGTDFYYTNEWYISLRFDDSPLLGTEEPLLNPYIAYYLDTDDVDGSWIEWGISHDFTLNSIGLASTPVLKDITVTPCLVMGIDNGQYGPSMRVANLQYGLDVTYDLSGALNIPEQYGCISVTVFVYFSDAIFSEVLNDELWGGVTFAYAW